MCWRSRLTALPPLRPASTASSRSNSWALPLSWAARPPLLAISRCSSGSIAAKPRSLELTMTQSPLQRREWVHESGPTVGRNDDADWRPDHGAENILGGMGLGSEP